MLKRLAIILLMGVSLAGAQETSCRFRDGAAPTASVAYVLCEPSTVMVTTDGGATWAARATGAKGRLRAIAFTEVNRGFVAGDGGSLLATEDGGNTWQVRQSGTTESLTDIEFAGQSGWISGYTGVLLHSGDGGRTWARQTTGTSQSLESIFFLDAERGWAVGWAGTILRTANGGRTWEQIKTSAASWSLSSVYFRDAKNGWAVGFAGQILRSRDGGATWEAQTSPVRSWLTCVLFDGSNRGWITVDNGFLVSEDGGESWRPLAVDNRAFLSKLVRVKDSIWALGPFQALKQADAKVAWQKIEKLVPTAPGRSWAISDFRQTVDQIAGSCQLQVAAGEAGVPEAFIEKLQAVPQVRAASPVIEALAETDVAATRLLIVGLDITGDAAMQPWLFRTGEGSAEVDPIAFIAQPDSLLMTRSFAAAHGWAIGSKLGLHTMDGLKAFTIRGLLSDESLEKICGGNVAVMDVYGAQHVFGRGSTVDRVEIALTDGTALEDGRAAIRSVVGPGYTVDPPSARGEQFEDLVKFYQTLYPKMRMVGADFAAPWRGLLWKVETAYIDAVSPHVTSAWTYAVQAEKTGDKWQWAVEFAGDKLTQAKRPDTLDLDRATRDSVSGHVAWNPNPRQTVSAEWFVHPNGKAFVTRLLYSRNLYSTFRAIAGFLWIGGSQSDPLARYNVDSYLTPQLRYSF